MNLCVSDREWCASTSAPLEDMGVNRIRMLLFWLLKSCFKCMFYWAWLFLSCLKFISLVHVFLFKISYLAYFSISFLLPGQGCWCGPRATGSARLRWEVEVQTEGGSCVFHCLMYRAQVWPVQELPSRFVAGRLGRLGLFVSLPFRTASSGSCVSYFVNRGWSLNISWKHLPASDPLFHL